MMPMPFPTPAPPAFPQHSRFVSSPSGLTISSTCSSKKPEPCAHCNKLSNRRKKCNKYPCDMLLHKSRHTTLHIFTANNNNREPRSNHQTSSKERLKQRRPRRRCNATLHHRPLRPVRACVINKTTHNTHTHTHRQIINKKPKQVHTKFARCSSNIPLILSRQVHKYKITNNVNNELSFK